MITSVLTGMLLLIVLVLFHLLYEMHTGYFIISDVGLTYRSPCATFNGRHSILIRNIHLSNKDTLQGAIKVIYDNLYNLNKLSLETTLLVTSMYNFFLSQGEYNANNKM